MAKTGDWMWTYCDEASGNVRYRSDAREAIDGWAYAYTKDLDHVARYPAYRTLQVRVRNVWQAYDGYLPSHEEAFDESDPPPYVEADEEPDPNY